MESERQRRRLGGGQDEETGAGGERGVCGCAGGGMQDEGERQQAGEDSPWYSRSDVLGRTRMSDKVEADRPKPHQEQRRARRGKRLQINLPVGGKARVQWASEPESVCIEDAREAFRGKTLSCGRFLTCSGTRPYTARYRSLLHPHQSRVGAPSRRPCLLVVWDVFQWLPHPPPPSKPDC